jgi:hypothetical protein
MSRIGQRVLLTLTLRHGSHLHHLGIGRTPAHTPALILVTAATGTVISKTHRPMVGEICNR